MITIKEMAKKLALSTTTVSNVIHGKTSEVSPKTVEKVQKMLAESDYVPNINARNLAQNSSKIIGIALKVLRNKYSNLLSDPFMGELIGSVEKEVRKNGYYLMLYISDDIYEIIQYISGWNADGLILLGLSSEDYTKLKLKYKKPIVLIDSYATENEESYVNIGLEDESGGYSITQWLLNSGHHKIAFISDNLIGVDYMRYCGFKRALSEHNISYKEDNLIMFNQNKNEIEHTLNNILKCSQDYSAFVCASDYYAIIIMNYLQDNGVKIPDDISITGFDDNLLSRICRPALTTVRQNVTQKGETAVRTVLDMIENRKTMVPSIIFPTELVIRNSTIDRLSMLTHL